MNKVSTSLATSRGRAIESGGREHMSSLQMQTPAAAARALPRNGPVHSCKPLEVVAMWAVKHPSTSKQKWKHRTTRWLAAPQCTVMDTHSLRPQRNTRRRSPKAGCGSTCTTIECNRLQWPLIFSSVCLTAATESPKPKLLTLPTTAFFPQCS